MRIVPVLVESLWNVRKLINSNVEGGNFILSNFFPGFLLGVIGIYLILASLRIAGRMFRGEEE
ncbi:MAG: hypothetical protein ABSA47_06720 [Verrucomicrobiota bacterium]